VPARQPARLLGIRLSFRREADAERQWSELLGGQLERRGPLLVYRWPSSPLRIAVEIHGERAEGPLFLELAQSRELADERHPVLGARFVELDEHE
jgi:hypothetical protein